MVLNILLGILNFYTFLIFVYVIMSWIPHEEGLIGDLYNVLGTLADPYLDLFRKVIPPIGALDISPIAAILVLQLLGYGLVRVL